MLGTSFITNPADGTWQQLARSEQMCQCGVVRIPKEIFKTHHYLSLQQDLMPNNQQCQIYSIGLFLSSLFLSLMPEEQALLSPELFLKPEDLWGESSGLTGFV